MANREGLPILPSWQIFVLPSPRNETLGDDLKGLLGLPDPLYEDPIEKLPHFARSEGSDRWTRRKSRRSVPRVDPLSGPDPVQPDHVRPARVQRDSVLL